MNSSITDLLRNYNKQPRLLLAECKSRPLASGLELLKEHHVERSQIGLVNAIRSNKA